MKPFARSPVIADRAGGRDNNFDLIRMLAATGVMVSHAWPITLGAGVPEPFETFLRGDNLGRACVFAFFVISGFYITRSFCLKRDVTAFLSARVLRLWPGLIVMFLVVTPVCALLASSDPAATWGGAAQHILTGLTLYAYSPLPAVFVSNPVPDTVNGSLWTLFYEVVGYSGVLICGVLGVLDRRRLWLVLVALFLVLYFAGPHLTGRHDVLLMLYLGWPFLVGMCLWLWAKHVPLSPLIALALIGLTVLLRVTPPLAPLFLPVFILALGYTVMWLGFARIPGIRAYNRLGDYSYGMYVYAFPVQQLAAQYGTPDPLTNLAVALPVTLVLAVASWHLVEAPALSLRHRFARRGAQA